MTEGFPPGAGGPRRAPAGLPAPTAVLIGLIGLVLGGALMFLVLRGDGGRYPDEVRANFVEACTGQGTGEATCTCMLEELEERYTLVEFIDLERRLMETGDLPQGFADAIAACSNEGGPRG